MVKLQLLPQNTLHLKPRPVGESSEFSLAVIGCKLGRGKNEPGVFRRYAQTQAHGVQHFVQRGNGRISVLAQGAE